METVAYFMLPYLAALAIAGLPAWLVAVAMDRNRARRHRTPPPATRGE